MAIHTGIPWQSWAEDPRAVATAYDQLDDERQAARWAARDRGGGGT